MENSSKVVYLVTQENEWVSDNPILPLAVFSTYEKAKEYINKHFNKWKNSMVITELEFDPED